MKDAAKTTLAAAVVLAIILVAVGLWSLLPMPLALMVLAVGLPVGIYYSNR